MLNIIIVNIIINIIIIVIMTLIDRFFFPRWSLWQLLPLPSIFLRILAIPNSNSALAFRIKLQAFFYLFIQFNF